MKRMLRVLIILFILAAIAGAIAYSMSRPPGAIVLTGIVTTDDLIVSAQVQGRLDRLLVRQVDTVKRGQLLAVIQPQQYQADMAYYENSARAAATQVTQSDADLRFQELQSRDQIAQAQANLQSAGAQVTQAQADLENARLTFERTAVVFHTGAESAQGYDQARTAYDAQKARVDSLQKQVISAQAALDMAKSSLEQVAARKAAQEITVHQSAAADAQMDKARVQLGYTEIHAPIDGTVDARPALQGEVVNPAQAIVTLIDPDDLWVRADVEETYIDRIRLGDKMTVRLPSGEPREGVVFYRAIDADYATQRDVSRTKRDIKTFEIRLRCDNHDRALALGMTAYVTLPLAK